MNTRRCRWPAVGPNSTHDPGSNRARATGCGRASDGTAAASAAPATVNATTAIRRSDRRRIVNGRPTTGPAGPASGAGAAILIATPEHCDQFLRALGEAGLDLGLARDARRLVVLDASATLER